MNSCETSIPKTIERVLIIPAAGRGVRFKELGRQYPKCILPVNGKPIIVQTLELLTKGGVFNDVIVPCADKEAAGQVRDVLAAHGFEHVEVTVIGTGNQFASSPALSLTSAMEIATWRGGYQHVDADVDVTVFLSDMIPSSEDVAQEVIDMPEDSWGVVEKEDFERWCMVGYNRIDEDVTFFDKPAEKPPTDKAAIGVYRYSSAKGWISSFYEVAKRKPDAEIQFSEVAAVYQKQCSLSLTTFHEHDFLDFGTLEEYLKHKGIANKCREFNDIVLMDRENVVVKQSVNTAKVIAEANWMQNLPLALKQYAPSVYSIDVTEGEFSMSKVRSTNLRDVALYIDRSYETWKAIFERVLQYSRDVFEFSAQRGDNNAFWDMIRQKTYSRVSSQSHEHGYVSTTFHSAIDRLKEWDSYQTYYHGDLHFANMFYCFHYNDLTLVDPRGEPSGGVLYDIAKLAHSVYGRYDYIDADLYSLRPDGVYFYDRGHENIERAFEDVIFNRFGADCKKDILILTASLFFSMIPLHSDNPEHCDLFLKEGWRIAKKAESIDIG